MAASAATAAGGLQMVAVGSAVRMLALSSAMPGSRLASSSCILSVNPLSLKLAATGPVKAGAVVTRAMAGESAAAGVPGLPIDLRGKRAFIAGVADDNGYGWAIAKALAAAGAEILVGVWVPALNIFETSLRRGKFDGLHVLPNGSLIEITKVYPLDAVYDSPEDVPEDVKANKRYAVPQIGLLRRLPRLSRMALEALTF